MHHVGSWEYGNNGESEEYETMKAESGKRKAGVEGGLTQRRLYPPSPRDCCSRAKNWGWRLVMGFVPSQGGAA